MSQERITLVLDIDVKVMIHSSICEAVRIWNFAGKDISPYDSIHR